MDLSKYSINRDELNESIRRIKQKEVTSFKAIFKKGRSRDETARGSMKNVGHKETSLPFTTSNKASSHYIDQFKSRSP
jgi:hypothetical protein